MSCLFIFLLITLLNCGTIVIMLIMERDIFIKVILVNASTNVTVFLICLLGSLKFNGSYFDIAIIYLLLGSIASAAYLKYFLNKQNKIGKIIDEQ